MLFSDILTLNEIIATTIRFDGALFRDDHDPEVDRFLNSSPPMNDQILQTSYEYGTLKYGAANLTLLNNQSSKGQTQKLEKSFVYEDSVIPQQANIGSTKINQISNAADDPTNNITDTAAGSSSSINVSLSSSQTNNSKLFTPSKVPKRAELSKVKSALTANLNTANTAAAASFSSSSSSTSSHHTTFILPTGPSAAAGNICKLRLTVYLPDFSPMTIMASDADNFDIVLKRALKQHAEENKLPSLLYNQPEMYELRMHEGDGEPDRDFPALDRTKLLKLFNEKEYCLCQKEASKVNAITAANLAAAAAGVSTNSNTSSIAANSTKHQAADGDHSPFRRSSAPVALDTEIITIIIPNVGQVRLPLEEDKCFRDILPDIRDDLEVRGHKLRLCTDEFVFVVPSDEQARLKMLSPYLTLNTQIAPLGIRRFELQKRVFADSVRTQRISTANRPQRKLSMQQSTLYTDTLANVYQEWNVKKKTKYGGLQDRVIGIDGKMVYNSKRDKRGGLTGTSSGSVARAQRSLNTIKSVEVMDHDKRALKISWEEDGVLHDVEYTCESIKDCTDIIEKLKYLLAKKKTAAAVQLH